ncbi:MAG: acyl-CoA dehydrogenase family protein [Chloroflexota bacterium]|nr:acyl-CoA/acyl-ACP dehydrogenase [Dehalococcoidia bacterium]MDW8253525.1 acyl-CoA dehydrogenase family protein [Chloroflexota bacterium]
MLELQLNEEEAFIQRVARDFLRDRVPTREVREVERSPLGYDEAVWKEIQDLGWVGLPFSAEVGGAGARFTSVAVLAEELGRACYPGPLRAVWAYGLLLERLGDDGNLRALVAGRQVGVPALWEADGPFDPEATAATVDATGALAGTKVLVAYANAANRLLVLARQGEALRLVLVDAGAVQRVETPSSTGDRLFALQLDGARALQVYPADGRQVLADVLPKLAAIDCAWMVGLASKAFELAVDYAKTRVQFGRPIGAFQAVQHKIADLGIDVEGGRFLAYRAAWAVEKAPEEAELALHYAKAWLNSAAERIIKESFQVHGAMGMTWEYDLQLALRRLKFSSLSYGDTHYHRERVLAAHGV